jgi:preprotein translocase subunit SecY
MKKVFLSLAMVFTAFVSQAADINQNETELNTVSEKTSISNAVSVTKPTATTLMETCYILSCYTYCQEGDIKTTACDIECIFDNLEDFFC